MGLQVPEVHEVATGIQHGLCPAVQEDRHPNALLSTHPQLHGESTRLKCDRVTNTATTYEASTALTDSSPV